MTEQEELNRQRDQMRGEMYADIKHIIKVMDEHVILDDERYKEINQKLMYVAIAIIIVAFSSGVLGQLIGLISIGS
jgi:hypothetical protein